MAWSRRAQSSTVQASGPAWSREKARGRLDADDAAERGRAADGAAGV